MKMEDFDAHIVGVYDRELDYGEEDTARFFMKDTSVEFDSRLLELIGTSSSDKELLEHEIVHSVDPEIVKLLKCGRLKIDLLINMHGGRVSRVKGFQKFEKQNRERAGVLNTYVGNYASSSGADLWTMGDNRYGLSRSRFLWHTGKPEALPKELQDDFDRIIKEFGEFDQDWSPAEQEIFDQDSIETILKNKKKDLEVIKEFFKKARNPHRKRFLRTLDEDIDDRHELKMSGATLYEAGLMRKLFYVGHEMKEFFQVNSGWSIQPGTRLSEFWEKACNRNPRADLDSLLDTIFSEQDVE